MIESVWSGGGDRRGGERGAGGGDLQHVGATQHQAPAPTRRLRLWPLTSVFLDWCKYRRRRRGGVLTYCYHLLLLSLLLSYSFLLFFFFFFYSFSLFSSFSLSFSFSCPSFSLLLSFFFYSCPFPPFSSFYSCSSFSSCSSVPPPAVSLMLLVFLINPQRQTEREEFLLFSSNITNICVCERVKEEQEEEEVFT